MKPRRYSFRLLMVYAILTTGLVFFLSWQLRKEKLRSARLSLRNNIQAGDVLAPFAATAFDGTPITVSFDQDQPATILCFLSSDCQYCHASVPFWNQLARTTGFRVIGVAPDGLSAFKQRQDLNISFPVVEFPNAVVAGMYRIATVPLTVVVNHTGIVLVSVTGQMHQDTVLQIRSLPLTSNR